MRITDKPRIFTIAGARVRLSRTEGGVIAIDAVDDLGLATGLGYAHAHDRLVQMLLLRTIGQGRVCECLKDDDFGLKVDVFMRRMRFARDADSHVTRLTPAALALVEAYRDGVNAYLRAHRRAFELALVSYRPEPWQVRDTLLTAQVMSYVGLAQSQQDMEKFLVQALQAGADVNRLKSLFRPHLDGIDEPLLDLLRRVRIEEGLLPPEVRFLQAVPKMLGSNNWAVAPQRSASGFALQANDPHLECNRLPAIFYEVVGRTADDYRLGISLPGVPGLVMGRTRNVSFGFTYGFMDTVDYFIEEVRDGRLRRGDEWREPEAHREVIRRKRRAPVEITVFEADYGVLETDGSPKIADGLVLRRAWSGHLAGPSATLNGLVRLLAAKTAAQAQAAVRQVAVSCNWLLADRQGNILYQQSGALPLRKHSGLHPVPAWEARFAWSGLAGEECLASAGNPPEGFLVTANEDRNQQGKPLSINMPMGAYRADRIRELLGAQQKLTLENMKSIQCDLYSKQAERFMPLLRPHVPDTPAGRRLLSWDLRYDRGSTGAPLFEAIYAALLREVFGGGLFGLAAWDFLVSETLLLVDYFHVFDEALLGDDPLWFGDEGREVLLGRVVGQVLRAADGEPPRTWGELRRVPMTNIFFGGKLPTFLGFDYGPVDLEGGRATVVQGGLFRFHGRAGTYAPTYRFVTDLGSDNAWTVLAGGPSGRRFSRYYSTDVEDWLAGRYKRLAPK